MPIERGDEGMHGRFIRRVQVHGLERSEPVSDLAQVTMTAV